VLCDVTSDNRLVAVFGLFGHFSEGVGMGKAPKAANMRYASRIVLKLFKESHEKVVDVGGKKYFDMGLGTHLNFLEA